MSSTSPENDKSRDNAGTAVSLTANEEIPRPPYDKTIAAILSNPPNVQFPTTAEEVPGFQNAFSAMRAPVESGLRADKNLKVEKFNIAGPRGEIPLVTLQPNSSTPLVNKRPGIVYIHGGAMIIGNAFTGVTLVTGMIEELDAVVISVDYGLAPKSQDLALVEDCYAALSWVGEHLEELGIDEERLMIVGNSAGGGLAAGTALKARDSKKPKLCAQLLSTPMLDDRTNTNSALQYLEPGPGIYSTTMNRKAWEFVLGDRAGGDDVSHYIAPARATDLSGLPPAFIEVGSAEPFRDEAISYANTMWKCGSQADLHVWAGGWHGFDFVPGSDLAKSAIRTREDWLRRVLLSK